MRKNRQLAQSRVARKCQIKPLAERLEPRHLLAISPSLGGSSESFLAAQLGAPYDDAKVVLPPQLRADARVTASSDYRIQALNSTYKFGTSNLTYSFFAGGSYYGDESSPTPVSEAIKANVRFIFNNIISPVTNLTFTEVSDSPTSYGVMRFLNTTSPSYAYAYIPTAGDTNTGRAIDVVGDVCFNPSNDVVGSEFNSRNNSFQSGPGSHGFTAIIHEIGHALGLKHTFESPSPLPTAEDNQDNSVMTYTFKGSEPATLMPYDLLALQYFYGANTTTRSSDTTYTFTTSDVFSPGGGSIGSPTSPFGTMRNTLWDAGGTDTLDLSAVPAVTGGYRIDIQPGGWIAPTSSYNSVTYSGSYKTTNYGTRLALSGTTIENLIVTRSNDEILLNAAANRISGYKPGTATGADVIIGSNQADTLDLSQFFEASVVKTQVENDLVLNLGGTTGTVTVEDYFAVAAGSRITILYKLSTVEVSIAATSAEKAEGTGGGTTPFTFTATRSGDLSGASSVSWAVSGSGTNQASAADFAGSVLPSGSVSFAANESTKTITVDVSADTTVESDEGFTVTLSTPTGATLGTATATGTIRNDDLPPPSIAIAAASAEKAEGTGGGQTSFTFTATRSGDLSGVSSVSWAVTGSGTNQASAADFAGSVLPSGSVSFAANESTKTITVNVSADSTVESDEGFTVTLSIPSGATLGTPASATGTIRNDDLPPPSIAIAEASADKAEGTGGGQTSFTFTATRSGDLSGVSSVSWAVTGSGTNQASAADFAGSVLPSGSVSFAANEATKTITVNVSADSTVESDEGFTVTLSRPTGATLGTATAAGTIRTDDFLPAPTVAIAAASAEKAEGTGIGPTPFTFTVTRSGDLTVTSSVSWAVTGSGGNQAVAADFAGSVLPTGSVSFAAGESTKTITVSVSADTTVEADEGFTITLSAPNGATLGTPAFASGTIRNDDLPVLSIGDTLISETDSGTVGAVLLVTLSVPAFVPVTVSYATFDRTATTAGSDYVNNTGTITFAPGETSKPITVSVRGDTTFEFEETFGVRLSAANNATIGKSEGLVAIRNDDARSRIAIAATDARKSEGNTGRTAFTFTVTRTGDLVGDVMLPWRVAGSGAKPADRFDFIGGVLPTGKVWFAPGRRTATVTVNVLADRVAEFDEQFTVTLQDPGNGLDFLAVGGSSATGTILNDEFGVVPRTLVSSTIQAQAFAGSGVATTPSSQTITPQAFAAVGFSTTPAAGVSAKKAQFLAMPRF